jgi:hypothetical protein
MAEETVLIPEETFSSHSESSFQSCFNRGGGIPSSGPGAFQRTNTTIFINVVKLDSDAPVEPIN